MAVGRCERGGETLALEGQALREGLAADVAEFLRRGGRIRKIPRGESATTAKRRKRVTVASRAESADSVT